MYQEFYGLKEKPFSLTPDPQFLYLGEGHRTAIESILYGIERKEGFMVVTGDIGTGKTTLCRTLLERLDKDIKTAVIFNSFLTEGELLKSILQEFGSSFKGRSKNERIDALNKLLIDFLSQGRNSVLIIDEAQNLSIPVLEQVRMLSNLETEKEKLLQIILFGQLELEQKLRSKDLRQLNQRITIRHHLRPLTRAEMEAYIYQRLLVAGAQGSITFSKSALNEIYRLSNGTPRVINLLCDRALLGGFVEQEHQIDKKIIQKARESLLGEEEGTPSRYEFLFRPLSSLGIFLSLMLLFALVAAIVLSQSDSSFLTPRSFLRGKIQGINSQIAGATNEAVSTIPLGKEPQKVSEERSKEIAK
jgi:general secretion pathway protein A